MPKPFLFLLDFDHTLYDTSRLKHDVSEGLLEIVQYADRVGKFWEFERSFRKQPHYIVKTIKQFCDHYKLSDKQHHQIQALFLETPNSKYVFPDVVESITALHSIGESAIFSEGDQIFQQWKAQQSGIGEIVQYVYIFDDKIAELQHIADKFPNRQIWYIDNHLRFLEKAESKVPDIKTCLMRREEFDTDSTFIPTAIVESLAEFTTFVLNT